MDDQSNFPRPAIVAAFIDNLKSWQSHFLLFCSGAVINAENSPDKQPLTARSSPSSKTRELAGLGFPHTAGVSSGCGRICNSPLSPVEPTLYSRSLTFLLSVFARSASMSGSAMITSCPAQSVSANDRHISGPIPAGSPAVTTIGLDNCIFVTDWSGVGNYSWIKSDAFFDERLVSYSSHPKFRFVGKFAVTDSLHAIAFF